MKLYYKERIDKFAIGTLSFYILRGDFYLLQK